MSVETSPYQSASLYVGDLDKNVTEAILFETFKSVGPVASIRVCRDAVTRQSLGYAYVNFHTHADAMKALEQLNFTEINSRPCRIMWSQRDPSVRKSGLGNIFIKNLAKTITNKVLHDTFSSFGNILSCKVVRDDNGESRGYGFVHYETKEGADAAIEVNGMSLADRIIHVGRFIPRSQRQTSTDNNKYTNLYIKNFPSDWTKNNLLETFKQFGTIQNAAIKQTKLGEKVKRFAFVNFEKHESAAACVAKLHGIPDFKSETDDSSDGLYVQRAMKKVERNMLLQKRKEERAKKYQGINLFVKNLDDSIDDEKLKEVFSPFGEITSCKIMRDVNGASRGFGFVCFTTSDEANKAITQMNSAMLAGKPLFVALAERKEVRRAKLASIYARMGNRLSPIYGSGPVFYPQGGYVYPPNVMRGGYPQRGRQRGGFAPSQRAYNIPYRPVATGGGPVYKLNKGGPPAQPSMNTSHGSEQQTQRQKTSESVSTAPGINLTTASAAETKQILGETLFPMIRTVEPSQAGKITGMLLESLVIDELVELTKSESSLREKISEALSVLSEYET